MEEVDCDPERMLADRAMIATPSAKISATAVASP
jgi:hypothetical protein